MEGRMITKVLCGNAKSAIAAAVTFLGAVQVGLEGGLSTKEVVGAVVAGLVALASVYGVPNLGYANAQKVVDAVKAELPPDVAELVDAAVTPAKGVLRTVVGALPGLPLVEELTEEETAPEQLSGTHKKRGK